jgi:hypothetical protein
MFETRYIGANLVACKTGVHPSSDLKAMSPGSSITGATTQIPFVVSLELGSKFPLSPKRNHLRLSHINPSSIPRFQRRLSLSSFPLILRWFLRQHESGQNSFMELPEISIGSSLELLLLWGGQVGGGKLSPQS